MGSRMFIIKGKDIFVDLKLNIRYKGYMMNITANRFYSFYFWYFIQEPPVR